MSRKMAAAKKVAPSAPPALVASPFRAEVGVEMSTRLRLIFAEPSVEDATAAITLYRKTVKQTAPTDADVVEMKRQCWSLLVGAMVRPGRVGAWEPAPDGWRESLWAEGGLSAPHAVIRAWGELFREAIRIAVRRPPRP